MKKYETLLLFSPDLTSEDRQEVLDRLSQVVQNYSGQVLTIDDWGMRDLAYPVQKHTRGQYVRMEYGVPGNAIYEIERKIRIVEAVMKFLTVKLEDEIKIAEEG